MEQQWLPPRAKVWWRVSQQHLPQGIRGSLMLVVRLLLLQLLVVMLAARLQV
jgi:hypothetical protein